MPARGQIVFHSGILFIKGTGANPKSTRVGTLQETSFDFKASNKKLTGENMFAEAIGRGSIDISGKAKSGRINGALLNQVFFAQPAANILSYAKLLAIDEPGTVAGGTFTVANGANFLEDLGVQNRLTLETYTRVAAAPAAKQYTINEATGAYGFNTSENTTDLLFSYLHKTTATGAKTLRLANQQAGEAPTFGAIFSQKFQGQTLTVKLNALVSESLSLGFKNEEFVLPDFSFSAQDDGTGSIGELSLTSFE